MLDLIFGSAQAFQQVGLFVGALMCFGLGALLLGNFAYMQVRGLRVIGTIVGVVAEGGTYTPVYRYTSRDGVSREAKSSTGSGAVAGKETGRTVPILVSRHNPAQAQEAGISSIETVFIGVGLLLALAGLWMGYTAITAYPVTPKTWVMAVFMLIYAGWHLRRGATPKPSRISPEDWNRRRDFGAAAPQGLEQVRPIEQIVSASDFQQAAQRQSQQSRKLAPFVLLGAVMLISFAIYQGRSLARLESTGLRAEGQVVGLKSEYSSNSHGGSYSYYPIVRYRTAQNLSVEFKDSIGTNPPSYRPGDKVTVLYLAEDPRMQAIIDRGRFWNSALPLGLALAGSLLLWLFVILRRTRRMSPTSLETA